MYNDERFLNDIRIIELRKKHQALYLNNSSSEVITYFCIKQYFNHSNLHKHILNK